MEWIGDEKGDRKVVNLPADLFIEILARLPAKSLMRFKCVQRSWNALFKTRTLVTKHNHKSASHDRLIVFNSTSVTLLCDNTAHPAQDIEYPFIGRYKALAGLLSYGPCNGIFCLDGFIYTHSLISLHQLILWNPATREFKVAPPPPHYPSFDNFGNYLTYTKRQLEINHGFGADPNTNNIKVVTLLFDHTYERRGPATSAEVYNLNTNSWTVIADDVILASVPGTMQSCRYNGLVDGVYHWLIDSYYECRGGRYRKILCFDFRNNQFRKLEAPLLIVTDSVTSTFSDDIAEVNDSLAYIVHYFKVRIETWIWNKDSWAHRYNIGPLDEIYYLYFIRNDGAGFLGQRLCGPLVLYNSDGEPVRQFKMNGNSAFNIHNSCFSVHKYVESVAPLSV